MTGLESHIDAMRAICEQMKRAATEPTPEPVEYVIAAMVINLSSYIMLPNHEHGQRGLSLALTCIGRLLGKLSHPDVERVCQALDMGIAQLEMACGQEGIS